MRPRLPTRDDVRRACARAMLALFAAGVASAAGSGPYPAVMEMDPRLPTHTIYRPADLDALGATTLPIVVWGNGGCRNEGNRFRVFLTEIASYGYLVIAIGPIGPAEAEARPPPVPPLRPGQAAAPPNDRVPPSRASQLVDAIDWAQAEHRRDGGRWAGRLVPSKVAVMGQSCGGVQAIEASADPRTTTTVVWNSGLFPQATAMGGGRTITKDDLRRLHAPVAYVSGDATDVAFANANDDFARLADVPALRAWPRGVGHHGTFHEANGGEFGGVAVAWLNWQLKGDARAGRMFVGPDCGLCVNPRWVVERKDLR